MSQQTVAATTKSLVVIDLPTKDTSQATFTFDNTGLEQTITDLSFTALEDDIDASLDMSGVSVTPVLVRLLEKVDGTNFEQIKEWTYPDDNDSINDMVMKIGILGHGQDVQVLITPNAASTEIIPIAIATYSYQ